VLKAVQQVGDRFMSLPEGAAAFCIAAIVDNAISIAIAIFRCRPRSKPGSSHGLPPVAIVRPLCGLDNERIVLANANINPPRDYIQRLLASWRRIPALSRLLRWASAWRGSGPNWTARS
jgi:hypothetical protein